MKSTMSAIVARVPMAAVDDGPLSLSLEQYDDRGSPLLSRSRGQKTQEKMASSRWIPFTGQRCLVLKSEAAPMNKTVERSG